MIQLNVLGNLGADAEAKEINGKKRISFRVASNRKRNGTDITLWVSVLADYEYHKNLLPYLTKGQNVFVSGDGDFNIYQRHDGNFAMDVSIMFPNILQLAGGAKNALQTTNAAPVGNNAPTQPQGGKTQNDGFFGNDNNLPF